MFFDVLFDIIVVLGAVLGTLVLLLVEQINSVNPSSLSIILVGLLLMVLGIALTAWGGYLREQNTGDNDSS